MDLTSLHDVNILGYSGAYLALLFESLTANHFSGTVNIILNDNQKRAEAPFETHLSYKIYYFHDIGIPPKDGFIFCSNKPSTKKHLMAVFQKHWNIKKQQMLFLTRSILNSKTSLRMAIWNILLSFQVITISILNSKRLKEDL